MAETEKPQSYTLTLKGDGVSISREIDEITATAVIQAMMGSGIGAASPFNRDRQASVPPSGLRKSLREALDEAEAKRMPDKIVTIGEFLISQAGQEDFSKEDVRARFRAAGEAAPGNFGRDFAWTVSNGWVAEDPNNPGRYYVTQTGKAAIEAKFSGEVKKKSGFKPAGRRRRRGNAG